MNDYMKLGLSDIYWNLVCENTISRVNHLISNCSQIPVFGFFPGPERGRGSLSVTTIIGAIRIKKTVADPITTINPPRESIIHAGQKSYPGFKSKKARTAN